MPFREATALISVEREGVLDTWVRKISGREPVVHIPIKGNYAPNVFVSVLAVRGRTGAVQPTAMADLGKPAFKLGMAEINVGWRAHELKVTLTTDRSVYNVREKVKVTVRAATADGKAPPAGSEVALAAVDEGLLELMANKSWDLLPALMGRRGYEVQTATAPDAGGGQAALRGQGAAPGGRRRPSGHARAAGHAAPVESPAAPERARRGRDRGAAQRRHHLLPHRCRGDRRDGLLRDGRCVDPVHPGPDGVLRPAAAGAGGRPLPRRRHRAQHLAAAQWRWTFPPSLPAYPRCRCPRRYPWQPARRASSSGM